MQRCSIRTFLSAACITSTSSWATSVVMAFQSPLSSVLLISSLLGYPFLVTKLFRLSVYFVSCFPLLLVPHIFPLNTSFSSPSALFICPKNCSCLFLTVLIRDLLYPAIFITSSIDFFSVHSILIILLMYPKDAQTGHVL